MQHVRMEHELVVKIHCIVYINANYCGKNTTIAKRTLQLSILKKLCKFTFFYERINFFA